MYLRKLKLLFIILASFLSISFISQAKDISLSLLIVEKQHNYYLEVRNTGQNSFTTKRVRYFFNGKKVNTDANYDIDPGSAKTIPLKLKKPQIPGSYNLTCILVYLNENTELSLVVNRILHFQIILIFHRKQDHQCLA